MKPSKTLIFTILLLLAVKARIASPTTRYIFPAMIIRMIMLLWILQPSECMTRGRRMIV